MGPDGTSILQVACPIQTQPCEGSIRNRPGSWFTFRIQSCVTSRCFLDGLG